MTWQWHLSSLMDPTLCLPRVQANFKTVKKNGYPLDGPGQNDMLLFLNY